MSLFDEKVGRGFGRGWVRGAGFPEETQQRQRGGGWFDLSKAVGLDGDNERDDVVKVQTVLGNTGLWDMSRPGGPTGYIERTLDEGIRKFQEDNGLEVDGLINPGGPTIRTMGRKHGPRFAPYTPPTWDQVEEHYQRVARGEEGILTDAPPTPTLKKLPDLPEVGADEQAINDRTADHLHRFSAVDGDQPRWIAGDIVERGPAGIARARDLLDRIAANDPARADGFASGILDHLPDDGSRRAFLGGDPPTPRPLGILAMEAPERMMANAAEDGGGGGTDSPDTGDGSPPPDDGGDEGREPGNPQEGPQPDGSLRIVIRPPQPLPDDAPEGGGGTGSDQGPHGGVATPPEEEAEDRPEIVTGTDGPGSEDSEDGQQLADASEVEGGGFVAKDPEGFLQDHRNSWLKDPNGYYDRECVSLVKQAVPGIGNTGTWKPGVQIKGMNEPKLQPGTAIATFEDGKYKGDQKHAAIFMRYGKEGGKYGIYVIDQSNTKKTGETFIPFRGKGDPRHDAGAYSIIKR